MTTFDLSSLIEGREHDPHRMLGLHGTASGQVIRLWRPGAEHLHFELQGAVHEAVRVHEAGLFEFVPGRKVGPGDYRVYHTNGLLARDPYSYLPTLGELDLFLFNKGEHYELYNVLGAHLRDGGVQFAVWAPNAMSVALVGDFNHWDGRVNPMRSMGASGIWELFVPGLQAGERYKFEVRTKEGYLRVKSDPYAFFSELRPLTASVVADVGKYRWSDGKWMEGRAKAEPERPINIYEVHLGSWRQYEGAFPTYRQLAHDLAKYCLEMGFSHVELLPIMEHPLDESWGYQVSGFFAATSRYGTPEDFQHFVDYLHGKGIGVLLDWVGAHFPTDDFSLNRFDGTALYEHEDPRKGMHPHWQTAIFNYSRKEVSNFLIASALFWIEVMHIDGLRVDAVASMLYLDYGRKSGEWIPNEDGSNFNTDAIEFLKHMNAIVHQRNQGVLMIAEESSAFSGVTDPNGLGFDLKWNMGWMNDTLRYFAKDPVYRSFHQNDLSFSMLYVFSEKFLSVLSHDEVVHGKGSLLTKMPGPDWQKFANVRLLYSYMLCHPGKKLIFMGGELGQWNEWDSNRALDWNLLEYPLHHGLYEFVKAANHFYHKQSALWEFDFDWRGYDWIDFSDAENCVISYLRKGKKSRLACVHNFTPEYRPGYEIKLPRVKIAHEIFNTDAEHFGGSNQLNKQISITDTGMIIALAPLATMIFEVEFV